MSAPAKTFRRAVIEETEAMDGQGVVYVLRLYVRSKELRFTDTYADYRAAAKQAADWMEWSELATVEGENYRD